VALIPQFDEQIRGQGESGGVIASCWRVAGVAHAVLGLVPGQHSNADCYPRFAQAIASTGVLVYALDRAGSSSDVGTLVALIRAREPSLPLYLLGHGSGAAWACLYAVEDPRGLSGLICAGITLDRAPARAPRWVRRTLELFSRRARLALRLRSVIPRLSPPLLVLQGSADTVAPLPGSEYLHAFAGSRDKTLQIFEGYYHDMTHEQRHDLVIGRIHSWIGERLGAADNFSEPLDGTRIGIAYINDE
jgi:alpha-beta hydrolase superfamily lysophospholipase